jgi:excisionase family DNA binding protein
MADNGIDDFNSVQFTATKLKLDRKTIYDAIARREIPVVRVGRAIRIPGAWLRRAAAMADIDAA